MGIQTNMTNRALRALETFGADTAITADEFRKYKFDMRYSVHSDIAQDDRRSLPPIRRAMPISSRRSRSSSTGTAAPTSTTAARRWRS